jgi:outer membrane lipoprotein-sorting protein
MRRITWILAIVMGIAMVAAGCGTRNAEQVVNDLDHVVSKLESYQGTGQMILQTGTQPQKYDVEVWYQNPHFYRISLTNEAKDVTQIVLRNDEGVFVLTPHLNKMFRFQSDWPENSGQVYLYQSLVQSIVTDTERQFATEKDAYVFDVAANYQNGLLARQKIWLNKKSLAPQHVEVSDEKNNVMVVVDFTQFEFGKKFEKDSFDMQRNMTSWNLQSLPTTATGGTSTNTKSTDEVKAGTTGDAAKTGAATSTDASKTGAAASPDAKSGTTSSAVNGGKQPAASQPPTAGVTLPQSGITQPDAGASAAKPSTGGAAAQPSTNAAGTAAPATHNEALQQLLGIVEPEYTPQNVVKLDVKEVKLGQEQAILFRYNGKYNYTLTESQPRSVTVTSLPGDILDLGYTLGVVTGEKNGLRTLTWTYDGMEFRLATSDLPQTEMILIAQSVQGQVGK